jgi:transcriptional/translational regulatory protein YebC/TACO1
MSEDDLTLLALDAGALDVLSEEGDLTVETAMEDLHKVNDALLKAGVKTDNVALAYIPTNKTEISAEDTVKLLKLLDRLDELDDVKDTHVNVDIVDDMEEE